MKLMQKLVRWVKRKLLAKKLATESKLVRKESMRVLGEFHTGASLTLARVCSIALCVADSCLNN